MNPAHLGPAAPRTQTTATPQVSHLGIIGIELPQQEGRRYDVILRLCRPLTTYESRELIAARAVGLEVSPDNPSQLTATQTSIEEVRDRLPELHELLTTAATAGHDAQETADRAHEVLAVEEARRQALVSDTNSCLNACTHSHDPAVDVA